MRYVIIFSDRTSKRVTSEQADVFRAAMKTRGTVDYKGCTYAGYSIVAIKPIHVHEQEQREEAVSAGVYRCKYGRTHASKSDCACRDAGFQKILETEEERFLLEEGSSRPSLPASIEEQNANILGFTDAKAMEKTKDTWTSVSAIANSATLSSCHSDP